MFRFIYIINFCLVLTLFACSGKMETRGYVPQQEKLEEITIGKTAKSEVINIIGYPSSISTFNGNWLYIETEFETNTFSRPDEVKTKVLEISFSDKDKVEAIQDYTIDDAGETKFSSKITPTHGTSINAMQQLIGNIGRFNKPK